MSKAGMENLGSVDDLLDFSSDIGEDDNDDDKPKKSFPPLEEEELEWLSNKDAFPAIETFVEYSTSSSNNSSSNNNSNNITLLNDLKVPVRARSKSRRRLRTGLAEASSKISKVIIGRKCHHCGAEKTPLWRPGPNGPNTLCNACGFRFKSGRLLPEYRPASSPTFRSDLHSNSHSKILEMRKQKKKQMK